MALEKESSPKRPVIIKPVFSYITNLVLVTVVFFIFVFVLWRLYNWNFTRNVPGLVFVLRLFELLVLSFGALSYFVYILNGIVSIIKLKRQLPKQAKEPSAELSHLYFLPTTKRLGEPVRKHPFSMGVCSVIILCALYVGISFAGLIQSNCDDVSILACELMCETGPDFLKPIDPNYTEIVLKGYSQYIENKHLSVLLKVFPRYRPKHVIENVGETLRGNKGSQDEAANLMWRAGEDVMLFRLNTPNLFPRGMALHKHREAAEFLLPLAKKALVASEEASKQFIATPTMEKAVHSCECNRITKLLLFPFRESYDIPEIADLFNNFRVVVEECKQSKINVAGWIKDPDDPRKEFLKGIIAVSEQRRLVIIDDIKERNTQNAIEHMWDAIEVARSERAKFLELCEKIRNAGNYSEVIREPSRIPQELKVK